MTNPWATLPGPNPPMLSESQRRALVSLLADEDEAIHDMVRERLLAYGPVVQGWLQEAVRADDPRLRRRALAIVREVGRREADRAFLDFCMRQGEDLDLEAGAWMLAQTRYPDIRVEAYQAILDGYACDLAERLQGRLDRRIVLPEVQHYLFEMLRYAGNEEDFYDQENSYLNRVIDRRVGNPISLCTVYLLLARRLRLPVVGIAMPGRFLCRYQTSTGEIYIDVFQKGRLLTKADCIRFLLQSGHGYLEGFLAPATPRRTLLRMCHNLHEIYQGRGLTAETQRFQRYIVALAR
ncbi:MAG TPA: transglutaminase-like domain-containing protein [Candidatus Paceibacterota bacterium]|nr:transglutaminase family protein [Verrucomicrobiota bacterium]HOX01349.1 transglutaminase-like domain-containing protein [Verrucomicrobiota bacterium]HRZ46513.1 transglutaminase-like domain-containing protein [Candidatus Paceibacterota bacterium]HRZ93595.1 transglutaminase-like domain-containing protein [Candidatus Paceibacterota bacterium]